MSEISPPVSNSAPKPRRGRVAKPAIQTEYMCELCDKTFPRKGTLKTHMLLHTGQNTFICGTCGKGFRTSYNLSRYLQLLFYFYKASKENLFVSGYSTFIIFPALLNEYFSNFWVFHNGFTFSAILLPYLFPSCKTLCKKILLYS